MECQNVREHLNILSDGERLANLGLRLAVARHCLVCVSCRAVAHRLKRDHCDAAALSQFPAPPGLKARVMASLPATPPAAVPARPLPQLLVPTVARVAAGVLIAAALLTALTWGSRQSMAAEVAAAVQRANTWHLRGWKLRDERRVPWEIWGRRSPFFYREQAGEALIFDDDRQRVQVIPTWSFGPTLFAVRMASLQGADEVSWSALTLADDWHHIQPAEQTGDTVLFRFPESDPEGPGRAAERCYTVDRRTWLPTHYEWRRDTQARTWVGEALDAQYDVPIPPAVTTLQLPAGLPVVDGLTPAPPGTLPRQNSESAHGLTAQLQPLVVDRDGNILASVRGWLGRQQLGEGGPTILFSVDAPSWFRSGRVQPEPFRTDDGRVYVQVPLYAPRGSDRERLVLFAPLKPRSAGAPFPRQLTASLSISPQVMAVVSRTKRELMSTHLFVQDLTWTVQLPEKAGRIDLLGDSEVTAALTEARANRLRMGTLQP